MCCFSYESKEDVMTAIRNARYFGGRTNIAAALEEIVGAMDDLKNCMYRCIIHQCSEAMVLQ